MSKKIKKYKVGLDSETYSISLVEAPAIEEDFIALSKQDMVDVKLSEDEKHIVYGAVLVPDKDIYRNNGENEYFINFSTQSIEKMSQDFMKEYRQYEVKTDHDKTVDEVCVVESWLKSDMFKDKSVALGLNPDLPIGTWFCGMKVNNIETWQRIRNGELKGFSVESMISLEEFEKQTNNDMIETNDMKFWSKMKEVLGEVFASVSMAKQDIEPIEMTDLEEQTPQEAPQEPQEGVETPKVEDTPSEPQNEAVEPQESSTEQPQEEAPTEEPSTEQPQDNHLEELINSLKEEIEALKKMNTGLDKKVKELSKMPSADPVNVNAKGGGVGGSTYEAWREQMAKYI